MKKKIVVFTGAGISKESGIDTFRTDNGLWLNHNVDDVASVEGFERNPEMVNNFYNKLRSDIYNKKPNEAHLLLSDLEDKYDVTIVTQNVDSLHELAGSSNIIHLHGELNKVRDLSTSEIIDYGNKPITEHDKYRPNIVWFGEYPFRINDAYSAFINADILIVIGTSFNITYTIDLVNSFDIIGPIYFIDPVPNKTVFDFPDRIKYIEETATKGMKKVFNEL